MNNSTAPQADYAGDEISALVLDPGCSTTRAGFAGEDVPKSVVPSYYGRLDSLDHRLFGENAIHNPLPGLEIRNPMSSDGLVEDWDVAPKLWEYAITSRLTWTAPTHPSKNGLNNPAEGDQDVEMESLDDAEKPMSQNPLLMTEPGWNTTKSREKAVEIAMEDWGCPAFYVGKSGVLAAFAAGKATALVVDVGASIMSVTPVTDGLVLKKGIQKSPLAGNFISSQIRLIFAQSTPPVPLVPHYMVKSKAPVDAGAPSQATFVKFDKPPAASFRRLEEERVLTEFKESIVRIWPGPGKFAQNEEAARAAPGQPFEMPDGWNNLFGAERYKAAEGLFDHKAALIDADNPAPKAEQTISAMINASLASVDVELRPHLLANIVVTGGSSLIYGFNDRLHRELEHMFPNPRIRVTAPSSSADRKFGAWIGGSVLGSLGTFQQMWISKKEYDEHGPNIVEKRCK
ncbi:actin family [Cryomyces antarcticus]